jgi:hypothetical protein
LLRTLSVIATRLYGTLRIPMLDAPPDDYLAPRRCMREPVPQIWHVADLLSSAADAHLAGEREKADALFHEADCPVARGWLESLWGSAKRNADQAHYRRVRNIVGAPPLLPKSERQTCRMPNAAERKLLIEKFGRHCVFCGIPLIRAEVRRFFNKQYPATVIWGDTNPSQHAGFAVLWMQFDHVLPHSRGGISSLSNMVLTCAGCNYGRMDNTLEELGLLDPRTREYPKTGWDGLERIFPTGANVMASAGAQE